MVGWLVGRCLGVPIWSGYESRFDQYDLQIEKKAPLTPRSLRYVVAQRHTARGEEILPLDEGV